MNERQFVEWVKGIEEQESESGDLQVVSALMADATDAEAKVANIELERRGCHSRVITLTDVEANPAIRLLFEALNRQGH